MGRNTNSSCKQCRRESIKLNLKGVRCHTAKCPMEKTGRNNPPGQHPWRRGKTSEYGVRLREKQKVKRYYGVFEKQFQIYFRMAERSQGNTGVNLLCFLERRLDNVFHKMGLAMSRKGARQIINHGHVCVNGRKVNRCSFLVKPSDEITLKESEKSTKLVREQIDMDPNRPVQEWLESDRSALKGRVKGMPTREDIQIPIEEQLIVELSSR